MRHRRLSCNAMAKKQRGIPEKQPQPPTEQRVLPMQLKLGDRLVDDRGEWRVVGRPYMTAAGKNAHVRVELVAQPDVKTILTWGAHERVAVRRG
jgi:hypothetical protein